MIIEQLGLVDKGGEPKSQNGGKTPQILKTRNGGKSSQIL